MGGSSSSSSLTSQTNTAINPIAFADNGSVATNTVNTGSGSVTNNISTLDGALAGHALDNMLTLSQDAFLFGSDQSHQAYGFATHALDSSLSFANQSNQNTLAFAGAQTAAANANASTANANASAAYKSALDFGGKQTAVALESLSESANMINTAYKDAKGVLGTNVILVAIGAGVLVMYFALRKK